MRRGLAALGLLALLLALAGWAVTGPLRNRLAWTVQAGAPDIAAMIPMPDGVRLATDVYLPGRTPAAAVLLRLPYGKRDYGEVRFWVRELRQRGFAVVAQDMRGRGASEGVFAPWPNEGADGAATLDWIAAQGWSTGRIGTLGCSALGESQLMLARERHPAHRAMVPIAAGGAAGALEGRMGYFGAFEGGVLNLASSVGWFGSDGSKTPGHPMRAGADIPAAVRTLPVIGAVARLRDDPTDYEDFLRNFGDAGYWRKMGYVGPQDRFAAPALFIDTWQDLGVGSTLALARAVRASGATAHAILGPGEHCSYLGMDGESMVGDVPVRPQSRIGYVDTIAAFLGHHLRGDPAPRLPAYRYYTMIEDRWRDAADWPPPEARRVAFALSNGDAALVADPAAIAGTERSVVSDPADPVPTLGGAICCTGQEGMRTGPVDQRPIESRPDLLLWTSAPLAGPLRIAGPIRAHLRVSTDTPDADLVLRLTDVDPEGRSIPIQEGALRLRWRHGFDAPEPMPAGVPQEVTVDLRDIAWLVRPGHRLRLHLAGSSFPRLERNLNTGGRNYDEAEGRKARITLHSAPDQPSKVELFVLPD